MRVIYLDYNGVLNSGRPWKWQEDMCDFLVKLNHLDKPPGPKIDINLLSYAERPQRRWRTLGELNSAGVLDIFEKITFTTQRTSEDGPGQCTTEHHAYQSTNPRRQEVPYEIFDGGKDAYIRSCHDHDTDAQIMLVDDKAFILEAAQDLMPCLHVTEMKTRHNFHARFSSRVSNFDELFQVIRAFAR